MNEREIDKLFEYENNLDEKSSANDIIRQDALEALVGMKAAMEEDSFKVNVHVKDKAAKLRFAMEKIFDELGINYKTDAAMNSAFSMFIDNVNRII